jgi:cytochrome b561
MLASIIFQLIGSLFMLIPEPYGAPGDLGFQLHQTVGLANLAIVGCFWLWMFVRRWRGTAVGALIPWFSRARRRAVFDDLVFHFHELKTGALPPPAMESPLASAIHGLGLLTATALAVTGGALYVVMGADGSLSASGELLVSMHADFGNLMWAYLIGHAAIALLHQLKGHETLQKIFSS